MKFLIFALALVLISSAYAMNCTIPYSGLVINETTKFCSDSYNIDDPIFITSSNVTLDCADSIIYGENYAAGTGIDISNVSNVTVKNCRLLKFESAFVVRDSDRIFILDNFLLNNQIGLSIIRTSDSAFYNYDVNPTPIFLAKSSNNLISSMNRPFHEIFCDVNYCNKKRSVVDSFIEQKSFSFSSWFFSLFSNLKQS